MSRILHLTSKYKEKADKEWEAMHKAAEKEEERKAHEKAREAEERIMMRDEDRYGHQYPVEFQKSKYIKGKVNKLPSIQAAEYENTKDYVKEEFGKDIKPSVYEKILNLLKSENPDFRDDYERLGHFTRRYLKFFFNKEFDEFDDDYEKEMLKVLKDTFRNPIEI